MFSRFLLAPPPLLPTFISWYWHTAIQIMVVSFPDDMPSHRSLYFRRIRKERNGGKVDGVTRQKRHIAVQNTLLGRIYLLKKSYSCILTSLASVPPPTCIVCVHQYDLQNADTVPSTFAWRVARTAKIIKKNVAKARNYGSGSRRPIYYGSSRIRILPVQFCGHWQKSWQRE